MKPDLTRVMPYGDTLNDGKIQLSFSLPVPAGDEGKEAAKQLVQKIGFDEVQIVHNQDLGENFSFYIAYGSLKTAVDYTKIKVSKVNVEQMDFYQVNSFIKKHLNRKVVVVGACTGTDAHTVGLDAIMNMKGYAGEYGLERYPMIDAYNLGSQVENYELIIKAKELQADVILISQVVTQKDVHIHNLTEFVEMAEAEGIADNTLLVVGGPRISHELAAELGFDAGFGSGTLPPDVASFIAVELDKRINNTEVNDEQSYD